LESDCCTDDRLGYVPMRVILAPIFSPVPTHSLSPPKEEMRSTLAGDSVFFFSRRASVTSASSAIIPSWGLAVQRVNAPKHR
jgi:hypothetical protein